jgi:hydroxymethylpyrimidine pyrophosphatase-like HAD family hydrolase
VSGLHTAGIPFIMVTGRPLSALPPIAKSMRVDFPIVCANGASVVSADGLHILAEWTISCAVLAEAISSIRLAVPGAVFAAEQGEVLVHEPGYPPPAHGMRPTRQASLPEVASAPVVKLLVRHPGQESPLDSVMAVVGDLLTVTCSRMDDLVEISAPGVTKASGLAWIANRLGVPAADVLAFGDMPNDIPMLQWAGCGVAMSGAHPCVLAAADAVTAVSNAEDGVASYLEAVFDPNFLSGGSIASTG